ncbi:MAG TPA: hypothetical protein DCS66_10350 [Flavobacteriaceae bacterium]|nr:hypothetical protein [Flavobacteriaceae bacterium]
MVLSAPTFPLAAVVTAAPPAPAATEYTFPMTAAIVPVKNPPAPPPDAELLLPVSIFPPLPPPAIHKYSISTVGALSPDPNPKT